MFFKPFGLFFVQFLILHISTNAVLLQIIMAETFAMIDTSNVLSERFVSLSLYIVPFLVDSVIHPFFRFVNTLCA